MCADTRQCIAAAGPPPALARPACTAQQHDNRKTRHNNGLSVGCAPADPPPATAGTRHPAPPAAADQSPAHRFETGRQATSDVGLALNSVLLLPQPPVRLRQRVNRSRAVQHRSRTGRATALARQLAWHPRRPCHCNAMQRLPATDSNACNHPPHPLLSLQPLLQQRGSTMPQRPPPLTRCSRSSRSCHSSTPWSFTAACMVRWQPHSSQSKESG